MVRELPADVNRVVRNNLMHRAASVVDCIAARAGRRHDAPVATADAHLLDLCHAGAIPVFVLPDTAGLRRQP